MADERRGRGRPCPERGVGGCVVAALVEGAQLEPSDRSGRGPRKWRRPLLGTAASSVAAPSLSRPPGAVSLPRRSVKSGGKATAQAPGKSSDGAVSAGARCRGAPPLSARRGSHRSGAGVSGPAPQGRASQPAPVWGGGASPPYHATRDPRLWRGDEWPLAARSGHRGRARPVLNEGASPLRLAARDWRPWRGGEWPRAARSGRQGWARPLWGESASPPCHATRDP